MPKRRALAPLKNFTDLKPNGVAPAGTWKLRKLQNYENYEKLRKTTKITKILRKNYENTKYEKLRKTTKLQKPPDPIS